MQNLGCHGPAVGGTSSGSMLVLKIHTLKWRLQHEGLLPTLRRAVFRLTKMLTPKLATKTSPCAKLNPHWEPLDLQPGDWVEIKSRQEISQTLDSTGRCRGLGVMPEMWQFCGTHVRVLKRVNSIIVESPNGSEVQAVRKMKHTVLLDGLHCDGARLNCDRACYFFFRECWLRRIPAP